MYERILLMGAPGTGKTLQLVNVANYLDTPFYAFDLEDKLEAMIQSFDEKPKNLVLSTAFDWPELKEAFAKVEAKAKPGQWIAIDRVDLAWEFVQRWYVKKLYDEELAEHMIDKASAKGEVKEAMIAQRFDKAGWQRINEEYHAFMLRVLYKPRCNVIMTAGIKALGEAPSDVFTGIGVMPRGQKDLAHQPHSVFQLYQKKQGHELSWCIKTAKDLKNRKYFSEDEELYDFSVQYGSLYWSKSK